jgi:uncharacterized protein (TIGR02001 family)
MKNILKTLGAAAVLAAMPTPAFAADGEVAGPKIGGSISLVSDYRFRGASLSDEEIAVQGGFSVSSGGFYAGVWGSNISFLPNSEIETDVYAGYAIPLGSNVKFDLGAKYVTFPGQKDSGFGRVSAALLAKAGPVDLGLHADYEPGGQNKSLLAGKKNNYLYATAGAPIGDTGFSLSGKIGRENGAFAKKKIDWLVGANKSVAGLNLSLQYIGTNKSSSPGTDDTVVFSVSKGF